ncbi:DUF4252 domain-containing protein [Chitinophaga horti]|uniref:DUF4252 domain-containing protein n=1 Tax=Chitinophaga horti TaxID=2920382 RepID=A0ABY6JA20_9BACT|nr:DUF4252 domain-containing protein [Chitinophaga horti]UYQ95141.1 DUF4252 domain-containing protein [Chitinophaga horti]
MLKRLAICCIAFIACMLSVTSASAQKHVLRDFRKSYWGKGETFTIGLGFVPLRLAGMFIGKNSFEGEGREVKRLLRKIKNIRIHTIENANIASADVADLKTKLVNKRFEPLMEIRDDGSRVEIMSRGSENKLGRVVMLVQDDSEMVMVSLNTKISMNDLAKAAKYFKDMD